jgi:hypothetical protein
MPAIAGLPRVDHDVTTDAGDATSPSSPDVELLVGTPSTVFWVVVAVVVWSVVSIAAQTVWRDGLARVGVAVGCVSVAWKGTAFNRLLVRASLHCPAVLHAWFAVGAAVGCMALVVAPALLTRILWGAIIRRYGQPAVANDETLAATVDGDIAHQVHAHGGGGGGVELVPIIPGLTVPLAHAVRVLSLYLLPILLLFSSSSYMLPSSHPSALSYIYRLSSHLVSSPLVPSLGAPSTHSPAYFSPLQRFHYSRSTSSLRWSLMVCFTRLATRSQRSAKECECCRAAHL